jgi:hypothetical protein
MKRNSSTLFLVSPGETTTFIPWVNNTPDFSVFTEPTLSVLQQAWQDFLDSGEELEVVPDPEPIPEPVVPNWDGFNAYMLTDPMFKSYRDAVRVIDGDLNAALFNAYALIERNGVAAFTLVWSVWTQLSAITTQHRNTIATVAESFSLPIEFVDVVRGE